MSLIPLTIKALNSFKKLKLTAGAKTQQQNKMTPLQQISAITFFGQQTDQFYGTGYTSCVSSGTHGCIQVWEGGGENDNQENQQALQVDAARRLCWLFIQELILKLNVGDKLPI